MKRTLIKSPEEALDALADVADFLKTLLRRTARRDTKQLDSRSL